MVISTDEIRAAMAAEAATAEPESALEGKIFGGIVIALLAAAAIALVVWGLAR